MICHNCPKRHLYCHATCEEYKKYRRKRDQLLKKRQHDADYRAAKQANVGRILNRIHRRKSK